MEEVLADRRMLDVSGPVSALGLSAATGELIGSFLLGDAAFCGDLGLAEPPFFFFDFDGELFAGGDGLASTWASSLGWTGACSWLARRGELGPAEGIFGLLDGMCSALMNAAVGSSRVRLNSRTGQSSSSVCKTH